MDLAITVDDAVEVAVDAAVVVADGAVDVTGRHAVVIGEFTSSS